jgi:hypothetical protein
LAYFVTRLDTKTPRIQHGALVVDNETETTPRAYHIRANTTTNNNPQYIKNPRVVTLSNGGLHTADATGESVAPKGLTKIGPPPVFHHTPNLTEARGWGTLYVYAEESDQSLKPADHERERIRTIKVQNLAVIIPPFPRQKKKRLNRNVAFLGRGNKIRARSCQQSRGSCA